MEYCVALVTSLSLVFTVWGGGSLLNQIACFPVCALKYAFSFNRNDLYRPIYMDCL